MNRKLIIFGAGRNGDDAWHFFGSQNIYCFVDNNIRLTGTMLRDKQIISPEELKRLRDAREDFDECFEVIVSVSRTRWATFAIVSQLQKAGIEDYSIYMDIRKRWKTGREYMERDRKVYPHEQETILEIYRVQLDYLMRHVDARHLLPATGSLRKVQTEGAAGADEFFSWLERAGLKISPFMIAGTLLGAVRHRGYIPWDDDLDFGLIYEEYMQLVRHMEKFGKVFRHRGNDVWETGEGERSCGLDCKYVAAYGFGYLQIYLNTGAAHVKENIFITDIMPVYYFADGYTEEDYGRDHEKWYHEREKDYDAVDRVYWEEARRQGILVENSRQVGLGHDLTSFLKSQHGINGRVFDRKIWDVDILYPLQKLPFEKYEWYAPGNAMEWLAREGYGDPMCLPSRTGVFVHDKDRIFREKY